MRIPTKLAQFENLGELVKMAILTHETNAKNPPLLPMEMLAYSFL